MIEGTIERSTIVVVDDQESNVRLLERILGREGFTDVRAYTDPTEALATIVDADLVLLDVHMPVLDGFAVLERIRTALDPGDYLPILFLTGDLDRDVRRRALSSGATDFVSKPLEADEVILRCRNLLETRRLHVELKQRNVLLQHEVRERTVALEAAMADRLAVASALGTPRSSEEPEMAAHELCRELTAIRDIDGAVIVTFGAGGEVVPLSMAGSVGRTLGVGRPLPPTAATALRDRASRGPWIEDRRVGVDTSLGDLADLGSPAVIHAPLRAGRDLVGVLATTSSAAVGADRLAILLPTVLEYGSLAGALLGPAIRDRRRVDDVRASIDRIIEDRAFHPVFQPVVELSSDEARGFEALTRFHDGERPDRRFAEAAGVGAGEALELACLGRAVEAAAALPDGCWLSLNVSPDLVLQPDHLADTIEASPRPVVLELTEHVPIADYRALRRALDQLGAQVRFAIDDAGAGFSSFRHIVELQPHFVKLDIGLVRAIDGDPARQAFVSGIEHYAEQTGCTLIAEGIETARERDTLRSLAVELGQGYLLGRPAPLS